MVPWEATLVAGIAGGVIGVGGTCLGAWLTGRTQTANLLLSIDAENKRNRQADKRQTYARFVASFDEIVTAVTYSMAAFKPGGLSESLTGDESGVLRAVTDAVKVMWRAEGEVALIAPPDLARLSHETALQFSDYAQHILEALRTQSDLDAVERPDVPKVLQALRADLDGPV
jgi:hypothetical protein